MTPAAAHDGEGGNCAALDTVNARLIQCRHHAHGHHQWRQGAGTEHHSWGWYRYEAALLRRYLKIAAIARYAQAVHDARADLVWHWQLVANCESGDNIYAVNPSGTYRGWLQFDRASWAANGGSGDPYGQPREVAAWVAENYRLRSGTSPWPHCGQFYR